MSSMQCTSVSSKSKIIVFLTKCKESITSFVKGWGQANRAGFHFFGVHGGQGLDVLQTLKSLDQVVPVQLRILNVVSLSVLCFIICFFFICNIVTILVIFKTLDVWFLSLKFNIIFFSLLSLFGWLYFLLNFRN